MPEEWFDVVRLFWNDETILEGRKVGGETVKIYLSHHQQNLINDLQTKHDDEMQKLLKGFVYSEGC
jgi:hypothetical protein